MLENFLERLLIACLVYEKNDFEFTCSQSFINCKIPEELENELKLLTKTFLRLGTKKVTNVGVKVFVEKPPSSQ